jgi:hypothetical protein
MYACDNQDKFNPYFDMNETSWGKSAVRCGKNYVKAKDVVIGLNIVVEWNWAYFKDDLMHHKPGYRLKDIIKCCGLLDILGCEYEDLTVMIFSRGYNDALKMNVEEEVRKEFPNLKHLLIGNSKDTLELYKYHA